MSGHPGQAPYQPPPPTHAPNAGQPRQGPQNMANPVKQPPPQAFHHPQAFQDPYASSEYFTGWSIRKPPKPQTWRDAIPLQQHVSGVDLQDEVANFQRRKQQTGQGVKDILDSVKSNNACEVVNELVDKENMNLW